MKKLLLNLETLPRRGTVLRGSVYVALMYGPPLGRWTKTCKSPRLCARGWHVSDAANINAWDGDAVFVVEARGRYLRGSLKAVFGQIRLVRRVDGSWPRLTKSERAVESYMRSQP